jgi:hypothetical protein
MRGVLWSIEPWLVMVGLSILKFAGDYRFYDMFILINPYYRISNIAKPIAVGGENTYDHEEMSCCGMTHPRMFLTKEERITHLNKYKEWLQNEAKGVDEAIAKLKEA